MKRYGWLFEKAFSKENIELAITKSSKGKRNRKVVQRILINKEKYIDDIYNLIWSGKYEPSEYIEGTICDSISGKVREICKPQFCPDHIIQWCIYLVLYPILVKSFIHNTCASIKGRGQVYGKNICMKKLANRKKTKYYLKIDIRKFYPSVNNDILIGMLERKIKDVKLMNLIKLILSKHKGLPIGMILSQLFANFYLCQLDHEYENLTYVRYADDIVVFSANKKVLRKLIASLDESLSSVDLTMKGNYQIRKTDDEMLDYMGYRMNHDKVIMRKAIMFRCTKKVKQYKKHKTYRNACGVVSYMGFVKNSNSWNFYHERIKPNVDFIEVKKIIRNGGNNENLQK